MAREIFRTTPKSSVGTARAASPRSSRTMSGPTWCSNENVRGPAVMTFLQLVINGMDLGAAYALVALGFVFIVNATGAVNFSHGDLVMAGGYAAVGLGSLMEIPALYYLPLVAILMFALGVAVSLVAYFPLINRPPSTVFIRTLLCGVI